jgi:peptidoglycan DL-endopeptidase LytE
MKGMMLRGIITFCLFLMLMVFPEKAVSAQEYRVEHGDALWTIAKKTGMTIEKLKEINHLKSDALQINQKLIVSTDPSVSKSENNFVESNSYEVKKGDCLSLIAKKTNVSVEKLKKINHLAGNQLQIGQKLLLKKEERTTATARSEVLPLSPEAVSAENTNSEPSVEAKIAVGDPVAPNASSQINESLYDEEKLLSKWRFPEEQHLLVKVALGFLGAPYRLGGCSVRGIDCSGFVKKIYEFFDIDLPRTAAEQSKVGIRVAKSDLTEGDLIFFKTTKRIGHVGIYIGNNKFVHAASRNKGIRIDSLDSTYYRQRYQRAVRLKGDFEVPGKKGIPDTKEAATPDSGDIALPRNKDPRPLSKTSPLYSLVQAPAAEAHW